MSFKPASDATRLVSLTSDAAYASQTMIRRTQQVVILVLCLLLSLTVLLLKHEPLPAPGNQNILVGNSAKPVSRPLHPSLGPSHPINALITTAQSDFESLKSRQSKSLKEAVQEYRRRYQIHPPPKFDEWYEFAMRRGVQLIDEYDTIYHSLLPFWGLQPSIIRRRAREALGFDNALLGLLIRAGKVRSAQGAIKGAEWQQKSTMDMIANFVKYLPDMDLLFNLHDEPRVILPHDDLSRLVTMAKEKTMPIVFNNQSPKNEFSARPGDMDDGTRFNEAKSTRFNVFAHQATWTHSRMSCSPDSPSRGLAEDLIDDWKSYSFSELGFIFNKTAFSDICLSPSLRDRFGFFNRPNAYSIVHDLFPVFSQSKISSYQDILYPSPWYWTGKVTYNAWQDREWEKKQDAMYWRGSTTGGFSRDGGWRHQHRQLLVEKINALDTAKVLGKQSNSNSSEWKVKEVPRMDYKNLFDVKFSHIGQCDPDDCEAQREFFDVTEPAKQHAAWAFKHLLDIDGNAFSGRFYAFLKSKSLVYKMAIFREWHEEWLRPWIHYIPLSMRGDEYVESVRYFKDDTGGRAQAFTIANAGQEWASKVLRNDDYEVWLFRLLLEQVFFPQ